MVTKDKIHDATRSVRDGVNSKVDKVGQSYAAVDQSLVGSVPGGFFLLPPSGETV